MANKRNRIKRQRRRRAEARRKRRYGHVYVGGQLKDLLTAGAKIGWRLGADKRYKRMGAIGARGHYKRHPRPWER